MFKSHFMPLVLNVASHQPRPGCSAARFNQFSFTVINNTYSAGNRKQFMVVKFWLYKILDKQYYLITYSTKLD